MGKLTSQLKSAYSKQQMQYVCINCGHPIAELYRKYSNTAIKTNQCVGPHIKYQPKYHLSFY